jgi:hypothetical protein
MTARERGKTLMRRSILFVALLLVSFSVQAAGLGRTRVNPNCGFRVVSYKFLGSAGTQVTYGQRSFTIPVTGAIELVASKNAQTYEVGSRTFRFAEHSTPDDFGIVTVDLSRSADSAALLESGI